MGHWQYFTLAPKILKTTKLYVNFAPQTFSLYIEEVPSVHPSSRVRQVKANKIQCSSDIHIAAPTGSFSSLLFSVEHICSLPSSFFFSLLSIFLPCRAFFSSLPTISLRCRTDGRKETYTVEQKKCPAKKK